MSTSHIMEVQREQVSKEFYLKVYINGENERLVE